MPPISHKKELYRGRYGSFSARRSGCPNCRIPDLVFWIQTYFSLSFGNQLIWFLSLNCSPFSLISKESNFTQNGVLHRTLWSFKWREVWTEHYYRNYSFVIWLPILYVYHLQHLNQFIYKLNKCVRDIVGVLLSSKLNLT